MTPVTEEEIRFKLPKTKFFGTFEYIDGGASAPQNSIPNDIAKGLVSGDLQDFGLLGDDEGDQAWFSKRSKTYGDYEEFVFDLVGSLVEWPTKKNKLPKVWWKK